MSFDISGFKSPSLFLLLVSVAGILICAFPQHLWPQHANPQHVEPQNMWTQHVGPTELEQIEQYYQAGEYSRAAEMLEQRRDSGHITPAGLSFLALCYLQMEDISAAEGALAISERLDPEGYLLLIAKGNLLMIKEEYTSAERVFQRARELYPRQSAPQSGMVHAVYAQALQHLRAHEYAKAADLLGRADSIQPGNREVMAARIAALKQTLRYEELKEVYRRFIDLYPNYPDTYAGLGVVLWEQNEISKALPYLQRAVELDSQDPMAFFLLGQRASRQGEKERARSLLREAIGKAVYMYSRYQMEVAGELQSQKQTQKQTLNSSHRSEGPSSQEGTGDQQSAEEEAERIERLRELSRSAEKPQQIIKDSLELLPELYENDDELQQDLEQLSRWYPNSVEIRSHLAEYYFGMDLIDAALKEWQALTEKFPFNAEAHLGVGRSYMALQRFDRALLSLRRALDLAPEDREVYTYLEQLYEMKNNKNEYLDVLEHRLLRDRYNPQLLQAAARAARSQGRDDLAEEYLQRAKDLQQ